MNKYTCLHTYVATVPAPFVIYWAKYVSLKAFERRLAFYNSNL